MNRVFGIFSKSNSSKAKRADLGQENSLVYDEKLKRWVEKDGSSPTPECLEPPAPPKSFPAAPVSEGSSDSHALSRGFSDGTLGPPLPGPALPSPCTAGAPPIASAYSAKSRIGNVRSRYVDTFSQQGKAPTPAIDLVQPPAPQLAATTVPPKFFIPQPLPKEQELEEPDAETLEGKEPSAIEPSTEPSISGQEEKYEPDTSDPASSQPVPKLPVSFSAPPSFHTISSAPMPSWMPTNAQTSIVENRSMGRVSSSPRVITPEPVQEEAENVFPLPSEERISDTEVAAKELPSTPIVPVVPASCNSEDSSAAPLVEDSVEMPEAFFESYQGEPTAVASDENDFFAASQEQISEENSEDTQEDASQSNDNVDLGFTATNYKAQPVLSYGDFFFPDSQPDDSSGASYPTVKDFVQPNGSSSVNFSDESLKNLPAPWDDFTDDNCSTVFDAINPPMHAYQKEDGGSELPANQLSVESVLSPLPVIQATHESFSELQQRPPSAETEHRFSTPCDTPSFAAGEITAPIAAQVYSVAAVTGSAADFPATGLEAADVAFFDRESHCFSQLSGQTTLDEDRPQPSIPFCDSQHIPERNSVMQSSFEQNLSSDKLEDLRSERDALALRVNSLEEELQRWQAKSASSSTVDLTNMVAEGTGVLITHTDSAEFKDEVAAAYAEGVEAGKALVGDELAELQENMDDLLVCLGQENNKVQRLTEALQENGVDVDAILQDLLEAEEAELDALAGAEAVDVSPAEVAESPKIVYPSPLTDAPVASEHLSNDNIPLPESPLASQKPRTSLGYWAAPHALSKGAETLEQIRAVTT